MLRILPNSQLHSETKVTGNCILCHFQCAMICHFYQLLSFYFIRFAFTDWRFDRRCLGTRHKGLIILLLFLQSTKIQTWQNCYSSCITRPALKITPGVEPLALLLFIQQTVSCLHNRLARSPSFCWLPWAPSLQYLLKVKSRDLKGGTLLPWSFHVFVWDELLASALIFEGIYNFASIGFVHIFRLYWKRSLVMKGHVDFPDQ